MEYTKQYLSHVEFRRGRWLVWITDDDCDEFDTREEAESEALRRFGVQSETEVTNGSD